MMTIRFPVNRQNKIVKLFHVHCTTGGRKIGVFSREIAELKTWARRDAMELQSASAG